MTNILLAGNHRAEVEQKGHNGTAVGLTFQARAFEAACRAHRELTRKGLNATLFTLIDHTGGVRELTGKRNNPAILQTHDLQKVLSGPLLEQLDRHEIPHEQLAVIPESTLKKHEMALRERGAFSEQGTCRAFNADGGMVCRGLAGAYMDYAVRTAAEAGAKPRALDWFIEATAPVPSTLTYTQGTNIYRMGMTAGNDVLSKLTVRGWDCTTPEMKILQYLKASLS